MIGLDEVLGQDSAIEHIKRRLERETFKGSFLLSGPDGVGKRTAALAAACHILGHGNTLTHPDLFIVEPDEKDTIKIDAARALIRRMSLKPTQGKMNVAIIDQCDRLTTEAGNALLKSIEEPHGLVILITSRPGSLLPTIRSRCQQIPFCPLPDTIVKKLLSELEDWSPDQDDTAVTIADGSLAHARQTGQSLLDLDKSLGELFDELARTSYTVLSDRLKEWPQDPVDIRSLLAGLRHVCLNRIVSEMEHAAPYFKCIDAIEQAEGALRQHSSPLLIWETLAFSFQKVLDNRGGWPSS